MCAKGFRKRKSGILRFAKLITEKGSSDDYHAIEKAKSKRNRRNGTCLIFITSQSTCLNSSNAKFILLRLVSSYS
jgi:hypothetical protein